MIRSVIGLLCAISLLAGCATKDATLSSQPPDETSAATAGSETQDTLPTDPPDQPQRFKLGAVVSVTSGDAPWAEITVSGAKVVARYHSTYYDDVPAKGSVYIQAKITYQALANDVDYNPFDWQVFVAGVAVNNFTAVMNGPKPELQSGTLPKGRKASGWVVYEVPAKGQVLLSYTNNSFDNEGPLFEVVLRAK